MASKKELENEVEELKKQVAKLSKLEPTNSVGNQPQTEIMFSVVKVSLTEIKIEKCTLVRGVVFERAFIAKDITMIAKSKLWKSIYELTQGRSANEESNINHQEQNSGENNNPGNSEAKGNNREGSEETGNTSRHDKHGRGVGATENNSEGPANGNVGSSGSDKHSQSSISNSDNGNSNNKPVI